MSKKPVLIIMAAGMGSRYGGLKQMDPIDDYGNVILNYSIYDAKEAGFEKVIFVIKEENETDFRAVITDKLEGKIDYEFAYQKLTDVPEGYEVPEGRVKPFGTAHAVRACRNIINDSPFVVINADDYYGKNGFKTIFDFLMGANAGEYAMVGYMLKNTVTDNGHVARGVCDFDENHYLTEINERTRIEKTADGIAYTEDDGATWVSLTEDTLVSMNFWGFTPEFMNEIDARFETFMKDISNGDPLKKEYFLPGVVEQLLDEKKCTVKVLSTDDKWHGVTYKEDKPEVVSALKALRDAKKYNFD